MRISDWSSDVCSSDLHAGGQVVALGGQHLQHVGAGGVGARLALLAAVERHLVEEDLAELLGRADGELAPGQLVDLLLQLADALGEVVGHAPEGVAVDLDRSEEHTSELQSLMRISYAVFCLKKKKLK